MPHSVDYYMAMGFDDRTARYFASGRKLAVSVKALPHKLLAITYNNGEIRSYDVSMLISEGSVFAFLEDDEAFKRVYIDENHAIAWDKDPNVDSSRVWSNKVDLSSDTCYMDGVPLAS